MYFPHSNVKPCIISDYAMFPFPVPFFTVFLAAPLLALLQEDILPSCLCQSVPLQPSISAICKTQSKISERQVRDLEVANGKPYVVGEEGIDVGTVYCYDRVYAVVAMPEELKGATHIIPSNDDDCLDGQFPDEFITFNVVSPVIVWVAYDSRGLPVKNGTPPDWLSEDNGWQEHPDMIIENTDAGMGFFGLLSKEFDKGEVVLGGCSCTGSMYIVLLTTVSAETTVESLGKLSTTWAELKSER